MYHDEYEHAPVVDFDEVAAHLLEQGAPASPSQVHGCLCGLLGAGAPAEAEYGLDALAQSLDLVAHGELAGCAMQLYTLSAATLRDDELAFVPLLPDDEVGIAQRAEALADWCNGFLTGFAYVAAGAEKSGSALSGQCSEALRDIAAMAQAEAGADELGEEAEESYFELVEYLRVAVVNIFMDNSGEFGQRDAGGEERSLH